MLLVPFIQIGLPGIASQITGGYVCTICKSQLLKILRGAPAALGHPPVACGASQRPGGTSEPTTGASSGPRMASTAPQLHPSHVLSGELPAPGSGFKL